MKKLVVLIPYGLCISIGLFSGCSSGDEKPAFDCDFTGLKIDVLKTDPADCASKGTVEIIGSLGVEPYDYALDNGAFQESSVFTDVAAGTHIAKVRDANKCVKEKSVTLEALSSTVQIQSVTKEASGCRATSGSIAVTATGEGTLSYSLNNGPFSNSTGNFTDLAPGTYSVAVKDANNCTDSQSSIKITTGVSLAVDVKPIISSNCAIGGCHNGTQPPNLTSNSSIIANASKIKSLTQSGAMPQGGTLSTTEKNLIACWVEDGAPNN